MKKSLFRGLNGSIVKNKTPIIVFIVSRSLLFILVYAMLILVPDVNKNMHGNSRTCDSLMLDGWVRADSGWYLRIVLGGYNFSKETQSSIVFFPLYPLVIKTADFVIRNIYISGILVSNLCFFLLLIFLNRLVMMKYDSDIAEKTLLLVSFYPFAYFFSAVYTESLFLLLIVMVFYYAEKENWIMTGITGMLAAMTRLIGISIFFAMAYRCLKNNNFKVNRNLLPLLMIPLGLVIFMAFCYLKFNDAFAFIHAQNVAGWNKHLSLDVSRYVWALKSLITLNFVPGTWGIEYSMYTVIGLIFIATLFAIYRRMDRSYFIYSFFAVLIPFFSSTFASIGRYMSVVFPAFIIFALLLARKKLLFNLVLAGFCLYFSFNLFLISHWYSAY